VREEVLSEQVIESVYFETPVIVAPIPVKAPSEVIAEETPEVGIHQTPSLECEDTRKMPARQLTIVNEEIGFSPASKRPDLCIVVGTVESPVSLISPSPTIKASFAGETPQRNFSFAQLASERDKITRA
jgi:hypothetical protein